MANTLFKATFFFKHGIGGHSWSLYRQDDGYDKCLKRAKDLMQVYMTLLGVGTECSYIRVSREDTPGDARVTTERRFVIGDGVAAPEGAIQIKAVVNDKPDPQFTALLINLGSSALAKGRHYMRLIPDVSVTDGGEFSPSLEFTKAFKRLKEELTEETPWGIMHVPVGPGVRKKIIVIVEQNGSPPSVQCQVPHDFKDNQKIRIGGLKGAADKYNGSWQVLASQGANTFLLQAPKGTAEKEYRQNPAGYVCSVEKEFNPLNSDFIEWVRIVSRRHGRPFGLAVGRRRARKS